MTQDKYIPLNTYKIDTSLQDGVMTQTLEDHSKQLTQWIFDTREKQSIDTLKSVGWLPPEEARELLEALELMLLCVDNPKSMNETVKLRWVEKVREAIAKAKGE